VLELDLSGLHRKSDKFRIVLIWNPELGDQFRAADGSPASRIGEQFFSPSQSRNQAFLDFSRNQDDALTSRTVVLAPKAVWRDPSARNRRNSSKPLSLAPC
jgi:hypothetical protein